ncbi:P-loop containing nucleoside triphosphate hydrolase protein [Pseudovirgaria hyperparasitica]|uniref:Adenylate kinase isoenzyme 6 homolog n=1 Tax=Pseudovirgaria hyperparasitica TaxID=470096 RepID=A0A6A6W557_9PEZI|nr:P-loop containing nucleoside triphosphate hydrolase protein [Pseudovirgaria hyperparasitica]KAF2756191.1 P-loop containing nucleoside triphosphate hydrolase protein [Pseudovirgaria hyperparasitica]
MMAVSRKQPNIVITGTPGVGKTTHAELLATNTQLKHISLNDIAKEEDCYDGYDEELQTHILDEDKLLDHIESGLKAGGNIIDYHACELFPEALIDLVVVIRCDSTLLFDRMKARRYPERKIEENMDSEIMQVILEEARESYAEEIVVELQSDCAEDVERNVERIQSWLEAWKKNNNNSNTTTTTNT